ncbi:unnamed protein product, partial [Iphiclides podalirius]
MHCTLSGAFAKADRAGHSFLLAITTPVTTSSQTVRVQRASVRRTSDTDAKPKLHKAPANTFAVINHLLRRKHSICRLSPQWRQP